MQQAGGEPHWGCHHLRVVPIGLPFQVLHFWHEDGGFAGWYVNFEAPKRRRASATRLYGASPSGQARSVTGVRSSRQRTGRRFHFHRVGTPRYPP